MKPPRRILVRGVNWLGDAVMTTPALVRLRERFPDARITLLCHEKLRDLWTTHPALDDVRSFASDESPFDVARRLRPEGFDLAILFPNSMRSGLEAFLARIPQRVGVSRGLRNVLLHRVVRRDRSLVEMRKRTPAEVRRLQSLGDRDPEPVSASSHQIHHYLGLVAAVGADPAPLPPILGLTPTERAHAWGELFPEEPGVPVLGLNAGAEYGAAKRWPAERFADVANRIHAVNGCQVLIFGGPSDRHLADQVAARIESARVTILAGRTSLRQLVAYLGCCDVLVTNDTGPMHVAAAVGVPVVVPFGSTSPDLTGPGLPGDPRHSLLRTRLACAPCFQRTCPASFRCMDGIPVDRVVEAVTGILRRGRPS